MSFSKPTTTERSADAQLTLNCRNCNALTSHATLASHGGHCYPCHAAYCREPMPARSLLDTHTVADMKTRVKGALRFPVPGAQA